MSSIGIVAFAPEVVLVAGTLLIFLLDTIGVRRNELFAGIATVTGALALLLVLADTGFAPLAFLRTLDPSAVDVSSAATPRALYAFTSLGLLFQAIFLLTATLVALASASRPSDEKGSAIFHGLLLLATTGMLLVAVAADLIFLVLAIEVTSIATYLMVGYTRRDPRGLEAAMKFYIIGALSTALSFFGVSLLYGAYGSTSLVAVTGALGGTSQPTLALLGFGFLLVGLGFKVTAVPFHAWAVDVYDGAPTDVSAFLAGGSKKIGIFAFFLVFIGPLTFFTVRGAACLAPTCGAIYDFHATITIALGVLAVLTMTVGNLLALMQRTMKRMLAYSSISQAGYMLIGLAVGTAPALAGATLQVFAHVFMKAGAFLLVAGFAAIGVGPLIEDYRGLAARRPLASVAFALMLLSLAGIPLTVGFVSKFILFSAAVQAQGFYLVLAVAGLLNSAVSVFYYARVLKVMYMDPAVPAPAPVPGSPGVGGSGPPPLAAGGFGYGRAAAIALATVAIVAFGVYPQPLLAAFQSAAQHFVLTGP
ncbi:MAG: NADH-quinone oxidoreductase subunit N [Thermoplasmata archaeon]|nr:NADH-quinone oxidoreductase subunit N [Thermoplasmata archaeon]